VLCGKSFLDAKFRKNVVDGALIVLRKVDLNPRKSPAFDDVKSAQTAEGRKRCGQPRPRVSFGQEPRHLLDERRLHQPIRALREMIEARIAGKEVVTGAPEEEKPVVDIMAALKQSIEQAKAKKKPMEKAKGEKKEAAEAAPAKQKKQKVA